MNPEDREAYRRRYRKRLDQYGHDPRTLGWASGKQEQRFKALTSFCDLQSLASILDVGCGFGDLYPFLLEHGFKGTYTGVDFMGDLIEVGRAAYPGAEFMVADFSEFQAGQTFDLVLASGIFNARLEGEDHWGYVTRTLEKMFDCCRVAAAADFLSAYVDYEREDLYYTSPEGVFGFAKTLTRRVAMNHAYLPFEFALCLFKDDRIAEQATFYPLPSGSF